LELDPPRNNQGKLKKREQNRVIPFFRSEVENRSAPRM